LKQYFRTIQNVMDSRWSNFQYAGTSAAQKTDRVLQSSKMEDCIYRDLSRDDENMENIQQEVASKLHSFPALSRDIFQSFYSLFPKRTDADRLTAEAQKFNAKLLDHVTEDADYPTIKSICEGRELPAYEAASEFTAKIGAQLDDLLPELGGKDGTLKTLEKLQAARNQAQQKLTELLAQMRDSVQNPTLEQAVIDAANQAESKTQQAEAVAKMVDTTARQNKAAISESVSAAVDAAAEKAKEVQTILGAWSDDAGTMEKNAVNTELLQKVRQNPALLEISKHLGRFREIFAQGKRNGYAYGRGETYALELGNDLSRAIGSEFAMLASPQTVPLFVKKYQQRRLKQYRRREPVHKGMGDIICCLDESGSTRGGAAAWGKAVALTLLDIAESEGRKFALIHFSGPGRFQTDRFLPKQATVEDKLRAAETFLDGGTDFCTPMNEALRLMQEEGFDNADIVFITDGECLLPEEYISNLQKEQSVRRFTITGILLDQGNAGMDFSLKPFCQNIYRTSELTGEAIVRELVNGRV
jgi:uncharacterized protein with von Willebrand factor type A (vWA) domain